MRHPSLPLLRLTLTACMATLALIAALPFARAQSTAPNPAPYPANRTVLPEHAQQPLASAPSFTATLIENPSLAYHIDPPLVKRLLAARPGEFIPILIEMREQVDLGKLAGEDGRPDRARAIVDALQATAQRSQAGVRAYLDAAAGAGRAENVRAFWIFNGLSARVVAEDIAALAARDDIALIREDRYRQWITGQPADSLTDRPALSSPEWGIVKIRANEVWSAFNITGAGVVVANLDTGVDWQHPALQAAYRGYSKGLANHAGNWYDATPDGAQYPIDPHGHGTHTMGTLAGQDGIGVAPGARWIAVRILNAAGYGYDSWIHAGFEWVLAPAGNPALAPDVVSNSWGNDLAGDTTFQNDLRALRSAGIFAVFSVGNEGPLGHTVGSPAALPEAFAAGATDNEDDVALFSSRGPSDFDQVRPDVVAPGVNVRSSVPGGGYASHSGTSMASPHVAGTVALMLSAHPSLSITDTAFVLTSTTVPLSSTLPNNDSGYGRIDAYAAVEAVAGFGAISGAVTRSDTAAPITGATVVAVSAKTSGAATSDANGHYVRGLASSIYTVTASAFGFMTATQASVPVITGATTVRNFTLTPLPAGHVRGSLTDATTGQPINGTIVVVNTPVTASANSSYSATLPAGQYELRAVVWGYRILTAPVTITPGQIVTRNFALPHAPTILLVDSGPWYNASQIQYYRAALSELGYPYAERRVKNPLADVPISATLRAYDIVVWSAPFDSPGLLDAGTAISDYLSSGGLLFLSGQDVGYFDGGLDASWSDYYSERLKARALVDNSDSLTLTGVGIFDGLKVTIGGGDGANNQLFPDVIASADPGATADAFTYHSGALAAQSVGLCLPYRAVYLGFGFEALSSSASRRQVMSRTLSYFASPRNAAGMTLNAANDLLIAPAGSVATQTIDLRNIAELGGSDTFVLSVQSPGGWSAGLSDSAATLAACKSKTITLTVSIPPGTPYNVSRAITVTARSTVSPAMVVSKRLAVKSPAIALLIDDDRFYNVEGAYQSALSANGISFDRWDVPKAWAGLEPAMPPPDRLKWYPLVVWFTGYDWYQPLTAGNEATLTQYLNAGGRVLLSAQDYLGIDSASEFGRSRLGILDHALDMTTTVARGVPGGPFDGVGPVTLVYTYPNYSDALAPYPAATVAFAGSHGRPIALARQNGAGKALFFAFPFEAIPEAERAAVMNRAVGYLSRLGGSTVSVSKAVALPGSSITLTIVAHNDGLQPIASAAFTVTLPPGVSLQSGAAAWSGSLAAGQAVTRALRVRLSLRVSPGSVLTIPMTFNDADRATTFQLPARVGIARPDVSASSLSVSANPAQSKQVVTWTLVARNTGLANAPNVAIISSLPISTTMVSGTLFSSTGTSSELSGTVKWNGPIPAGAAVTLSYQMSVPGTLSDRLYFGSALVDDGLAVSYPRLWLAVRPNRLYLPQVYK